MSVLAWVGCRATGQVFAIRRCEHPVTPELAAIAAAILVLGGGVSKRDSLPMDRVRPFRVVVGEKELRDSHDWARKSRFAASRRMSLSHNPADFGAAIGQPWGRSCVRSIAMARAMSAFRYALRVVVCF